MEIFWWYSNQSLANTAGQKRCFTKMDIPQDSRLSSGSLIKGKIYLDNSISDGFFETRIYWNGKSNQYNSMFPTIMYWYWLIHQSIFSGRIQNPKIQNSVEYMEAVRTLSLAHKKTPVSYRTWGAERGAVRCHCEQIWRMENVSYGPLVLATDKNS